MKHFILIALVTGCWIAILPAHRVTSANEGHLQMTACCGYWVASTRDPRGDRDRYAMSNVFRRLPCGDVDYERQVLKYVYELANGPTDKIHLDCRKTRAEANRIRGDILRRHGKPKTVWAVPDAPLPAKQRTPR